LWPLTLLFVLGAPIAVAVAFAATMQRDSA
jgi:hypothetical protein